MAGKSSWLTRPALLRTLLSRLRLAARLIREPGVPLLARTLPLFAALYVISPIDFLPDVFPVLGQLDDLTVAIAALETFLRVCPPRAKAFHETAIAHGRPFSPMPENAGNVVDAEWRRQ